MQWGANRALLDTLYDEAATDYMETRQALRNTRADLDTCLAIGARQSERFEQASFELDRCEAEKAMVEDKVKRLRVWAWISKAMIAVGAVFVVKELVDTAKP